MTENTISVDHDGSNVVITCSGIGAAVLASGLLIAGRSMGADILSGVAVGILEVSGGIDGSATDA